MIHFPSTGVHAETRPWALPAAVARDDLTSAVAARRKLGPDYDRLFLDRVMENLDETLRDRVVADVAARLTHDRELIKGERAVAITLFCVTMAAAIPLIAIAVNTGLVGPVIVWGCLTLIDIGYVLRLRRR